MPDPTFFLINFLMESTFHEIIRYNNMDNNAKRKLLIVIALLQA